MGILLPILAFAAFAALSSPKTSNKALPPVEPDPNLLPPNVSLIPVEGFSLGFTIVLGPDIDAEETDEAMEDIIWRAETYPEMIFEVLLDDEIPGIAVDFIVEDEVHSRWAEDVSYLAPEMDSLIANFIPVP